MSTTEREAFEKWASDKGYNLKFDEEIYLNNGTYWAFEGWQARAQIVTQEHMSEGNAIPGSEANKNCPFCTSKPFEIGGELACVNAKCPIQRIRVPVILWNQPRQTEPTMQLELVEKVSRAIFESQNPNSSWAEYSKLAGKLVFAENLVEEFRSSAIAAIEAIQGAQLEDSGQGWISVKDKMPEVDHEYYLVNWDYLDMRYSDKGKQHVVFFKYGKFEVSHKECITHWQPLPAPPEPHKPAEPKGDL